MGFKLAEQLGDNENIEEVIQRVWGDKAGFKMLLKDNDLSGDFVVLIVHIISKVSESSFDNTKLSIYENVFRNSTYIKQLRAFITSSPYHDPIEKRKNNYFWSDYNKFWYNLESIFKDMTSIPSLASEVLPKLLESIIITIPILENQQNIHISDDIKKRFEVLQHKIKKIELDMKQKYQSKDQQADNNYRGNEDDWIPPNDFRMINVYPDIVEVAFGQEPFIRKNKTVGSYQNVDHYLDVQFRLLREDFISPLRRGICQYLENSNVKKYDDIKIHPKVHFLSEENVNELKCFRIRFDFSKEKKSLKYEDSKQFMFGSLVCFSNDRFVTVIFAKIVKRDPDMMKKGELIVGIDDYGSVPIHYYSDYIMVESKVYFEPYFHVLKALQRITEDNFPLERYLIETKSDVSFPKYIDNSTVFRIDKRLIYPMNWHDQYQLYSLNDSQELALKASLTSEISIIQGPPGTGKTFLGLKIAHILLTNKDYWYKNTPLLVICFTNHALDQFLEGILFSTEKLLRIGGQSKSPVLQNYNLNNKKRPRSGAFYQAQRELTLSLNDLKAFDNVINQIGQYNSILDFSFFRKTLEDTEGTWFHTASGEDIKNWLLQNANAHRTTPSKPDISIFLQENSDSNSDDELSIYGDDAENEEVDEIFTNITISKSDGSSNEGIKQTYAVRSLISLQSLQTKIQELEKDMDDPLKMMMHATTIETDLRKLRNEYEYLKHNLEQLKNGTHFQQYILRKNPFEMTTNERWALYHHFLKQFLQYLMNERKGMNDLYQKNYKIYSEQKDIEDVKAMRESLVIGMTTTSAARLRPVLQALKSPIVIVEEAAEVLEAHVIAALTVHCKQLILIGDHQQLRPTTADYTVETKYRMGVSLFERMIRNDIQYHTLNVQHRMRPEICDLIRPSIYRDLKDHISVLNRPEILGVDKSLFFITHEKKEASFANSSKKNLHEVTFSINLAKYLVLSGYKPQNITILAAYLGQMYEMQRERKKYSLILRDVNISVLDNYQGEENDIILLSLVRNNEENKNGFLKITNRVCVALSRARNGLYIMGNMDQLCVDKNTIWLEIKQKLEEQKAIGTSLDLRCQIHNTITSVKNDVDFIHRTPEGGCSLKCGADLACGHVCTSICHLSDRDHKNYICTETCGRKLCEKSEKHLCEKPCYEKCAPCHYPCRCRLGCGHSVTLKCHIDPKLYACIELVPTLLPCCHNEDKPCHVEVEAFTCPQPCETLLDCGHACTLSCHDRKDPDHINYKCPKPCGKIRNGCSTNKHMCRKLCNQECEPCEVKVKKHRTGCSHVDEVPCNADVDLKECTKPCTRILPCGHKCGNKCCSPCGPCIVTVKKVVPECEHKIKIECHKEPKRQHCKDACNRKLPCGHNCGNKCRDECTDTCHVMTDCNLLSTCGHIVKQIKCFEKVSANHEILLKYCTEPCQQILQCTHKCTGTCGQCFQGRIHVRCAEKCGVPLVCNHECPIPCREACKPCERKCNYKCRHGRCTKKCGDICVKCVEECPRKCIHQTCRRKCGDICDVEPCEMPCPKELRCGHKCVGFCNEPCPKLCRICDEDELLEIIFGTEDEDDARFVELQDCGHVVESTGMQKWLKTDNGEIQMRVCPKCKAPIINTQRYIEFVKKAFIDINNVKLKLNGTLEENTKLRIDLLKRIKLMRDKAYQLYNNPKLLLAVGRFESRLQETKLDGRRGQVKQTFNATILKYVTSKVQIVEHIIETYDMILYGYSGSSAIVEQVDLLLNPLLRDEEEITIQEIEDIQLEMSRLKRMVELFQIKMYRGSVRNQKLENIEKLVTSKKRYSDTTDREVEEKLKNLHSGIKISDSERTEIVKALGLSKGHWFKCPNGHPYVITECGGAMQEFECPDCGEKIGGSHHTLTSSNQLASEMDGAQFAAWSNVANNMGNYDLRQFQFN